ncbi:MAG: hypothetical protein C4523_06575, partial [Myxococcales bacterium]
MRHYGYIVVIVGALLALGLFAGCKSEPPPPPPECQTDYDCGVNQACEAGKCIKVATTPKMRAEAYIKRAEMLLAESRVNYPAVIEAYQAALREVPGVLEIEFNVGLCYMKMGDYERAESVFLRAKAEKPDDPNPVLALSRLYKMRGQNDKAMQTLNDYLASYPTNLEVRTNLATLYREAANFSATMEQIRAIFVRDPAHPGAFNNLGLLYLAQGKLLLARMVTINGIQAQENVKKVPDGGLFNNLGLIYLKLGDKDRAVANFRKANQVDPTLVSANLNLGHISLDFADFATAKKHYELVLSQEPENLEARQGLAQTLAGLGQHGEALALYQQLLRERSNDPVATFNLAVFYFDYLKNQSEAHNLFRRFLSMQYPDVRKNELANQYLQMEVTPDEAKPEAAQGPEMSAEDAAKMMEAAESEAAATGATEAAPAEAAPAEPAATPAPEQPAPAPEPPPAPAPEQPAPTPEPAPAPAPEQPAPAPEAAAPEAAPTPPAPEPPAAEEAAPAAPPAPETPAP